MKTTGAQWNAYLASWPEGQWFDDSDETINGKPGDEIDGDIPADAVVEFSCGVIYADRDDAEGVALVSHFRKWLKAQSTAYLLCEVPKGKEDELKAFLKRLGGRVAK